MSLLDQYGNPMRRPGRGAYRMVGDGVARAVEGAYRGAGAGVREVAGQSRKAGEKMTESAKSMKERVQDMRPAESVAGAYDDTVNYMMGKPTAMELSDQFNIALTNNRAAEIALRALPATAAVGTVLGLGNVVFGGDTFANKAMDTLGMGAGVFGMHQYGGIGGTTPAGRTLRATGGMAAGKLGSDLIQLIAGGGQSDTDRRLAEAIVSLEGGRN